MKRTPLKRKPCKWVRQPISKIGKKQIKRNKELSKIPPPTDGLCVNCRKPPDFRGLGKHHIKFRSHSGTDNKSNIAWLCGKCHSKKHGINEV